MLFEASLVVGAIAVLFPWFAVLATQEAGRDGRFANSVVVSPDLPEPILPTLCANIAADAHAILRDALCKHVTLTHRAERSTVFRAR